LREFKGAKPPFFYFKSPSPRVERGTKGVRLINKNLWLAVENVQAFDFFDPFK
jgi:hypothetical protein